MKTRVFSTLIKSSRGFFAYCFDDEEGYCKEFDTISEARRAAKEYSKEHPDFEVVLYGLSSMRFMNGKEI